MLVLAASGRSDLHARCGSHPHPHQPDARASAIGDRRRAAEDDDRLDLRTAERRLRGARRGTGARAAARNQRAPGAPSRDRTSEAGVAAADPAAALGGDAGAGRSRAIRRGAGVRRHGCVRRSSVRAWPATSRPARSIRSSSGCHACSIRAERLTYDGYVAHGLRRSDRSLHRARRAHLDAGDLCVSDQREQVVAGAADCRRGRSHRRRSPAFRWSTASWRAAFFRSSSKG